MSFLKKLFPFPGGLDLSKHNAECDTATVCSTATPVFIPQRLIFPLQQRHGAFALPVVSIDDHVLKGQLIAKTNEAFGVPIHASSSGKITAIRELPTAHRSEINTTCIELETDGQDQWGDQLKKRRKITNEEYMQLSTAEIRQRIHNAGIVGMGGAGFPSASKLDAAIKNNIDTLILNGAECEPYISCDDVLMRTRANDIIAGAKVMLRALQIRHCIIAIEDDKTQAITTLTESLKQTPDDNLSTKIEIIAVPAIYPAGGEKQLIKLLTNKNIAKQRRPDEFGLICFNIATAAATYRAIYFNEPLLSRIVTVIGAVPQTKNQEVLIGTPVGALIEHSGGHTQSINQIIMGGPMMGTALHSSEIPIDKTTLCIIVKSATAELTRTAPFTSKTHVSDARPCIRCGACADSCPVKLLPQQLFWHAQAKEIVKTQEYHVMDCIECGCCEYVCPSYIPLVEYFRYAKAEIRALQQDKIKANIARQRHEFRIQRLQREKKQRAERHKKKVDELLKKPQTMPVSNISENLQKPLIG